MVSPQSHNLRFENARMGTLLLLSLPGWLAGCSHPKSSDILHALLQAPRLQASAAAGTSADPAWKNSWLGEYSYFYLLFCILTLHCKC